MDFLMDFVCYARPDIWLMQAALVWPTDNLRLADIGNIHHSLVRI